MANKKGVKLLIFDFDGTLVDTKSIYYETMNKCLGKYFSEKEIKEFIAMGFNLNQTIEKMGFSKIRSWFIRMRIIWNIRRKINKAAKCKNISSLEKVKINKIIVSNSYRKLVDRVLKKQKIQKYFSEVYGAEDFEDKVDFIKNYLKEKSISPKDVAYIGDRSVDVEVAEGVGCISLILMNGCSWDSKKEVLKKEPDFIISSLEDLEEIF